MICWLLGHKFSAPARDWLMDLGLWLERRTCDRCGEYVYEVNDRLNNFEVTNCDLKSEPPNPHFTD